MSHRQLGGPPPRRDEDIQDAEFVEVEDWQATLASPQPAAPPPSRLRGCLSYGLMSLAVVLLLFIAMCVANPPPEFTATDGNVEALTDEAATSDPAGEELPALPELVQSDDARACGHPDTVATIRERILPTNGNEDARTARILELAQVELTEVTASNIRPDVHELTCDANLRYGDGPADAQPITFKIRAAADPAKPPVFYIDMPLWDFAALAAAITDRPRAIVDAERAEQAPPPAETEPSDPVSPPENDGAAVPPSDEDQFAPH
jgi:hypothetical protein